jgi:ADP-dependent NAD(P)H-hydrate dehydratase
VLFRSPGLGHQNPEDIRHAVSELKTGSKGVVLDADALRPGALDGTKGTPAVVTPHAGEFERLFKTRLPDDLDARIELTAQMAKESGVTVLLKGSTDVISDGTSTATNDVHSPAMTVGGTGDVLTGITAGLVAKGIPAFESACAAAFLNGSAGVEAAREFGLHIVASDLISFLPAVMKKFDRLQ